MGVPSASSPATPRWVKISGAVAAVFVVAVLAMRLIGHDPSRHMHLGGAPVAATSAARPGASP